MEPDPGVSRDGFMLRFARAIVLLLTLLGPARAQSDPQPTVLRPARQHCPAVGSLAWLPDGSAFVVVTGVEVELVDARTGKVAWTLPPETGGRMGGEDSSAVVVSHDGKVVALSRNDDPVRLLETASGAEVCRLDLSGRVLAFQHEDLVLVVQAGWRIHGVELADLKVRWSVDAEDRRWLGTYQGRGLLLDEDADAVHELDLHEGPLPEGTLPWAPALPAGRYSWQGVATTKQNSLVAWTESELVCMGLDDNPLVWARPVGGGPCDPVVAGSLVAVTAFPPGHRRDATRLLVLDTRDGDEVLDVELPIVSPDVLAIAPDAAALVLGGDDGELVRIEVPRRR